MMTKTELLGLRVPVTLVTILFVNLCFGNICTKEQDCTKCIAKSNCAWCTNPVYEALNHVDRNRPRCNTIKGHEENKFCSSAYLENPQSGQVIAPDALGEKHISPQRIQAKLRVEQPIEFYLTYNNSQDKPLDLYYIMDLSATMKDDKETVAAQGGTLAQELKKITKDLLIGFGSFIDKPVMPFVSSTQLEGMGSSSTAIPYGFKNHLNLTDDINLFKNIVNAAQISANLDAPEGGLDAIMQAITCNAIGWREKARKLIVMATDGPFHIAGDGKLGGIVRPNDGYCHMKSNMYTHSTLLDYPSVAQLNSKVLEKKAYVIFAIGHEHLQLYEQLSKRISSSAAAGLEADSTNVVKLVRNEYQKISERVKLEMEPAHIPYLRVTFLALCGRNSAFVETNQCEQVKVGDLVKFRIKVELTRCPKASELPPNSKLNISFTTFDLRKKDYLQLEIEPLCTCACSKQRQWQDKPDEVQKICLGPGAFMRCGLCQCATDRHGRNCECSKSGDEEDRTDAPCIKPNTNATCSNRGKCECGVCKCDSDHRVQYSGKYCQFDDSACRNEGSYEICSSRGECEEGKCACRPKGMYEGNKCQCHCDNTTCIEPGSSSNEVCNGNGDCECSQNRKCICKANYAGLYCQKCSTGCASASTRSRCKDKTLQACVKCHIDESIRKIPRIESKCQKDCKISFKVDDIDTYQVSTTDSISAKDNEIRCTLDYNDTCSTEFLYSYLQNPRLTLYVSASTSLNCVEEPPILWYVIGVIGGVLLIGIFLLLLWKLITHVHDKREYSRFEKERAGARWDKSENPLYSKPTTEFQNPAYKG